MNLRDEIIRIITHGIRYNPTSSDYADAILSLPEMVALREKAQKWDEVENNTERSYEEDPEWKYQVALHPVPLPKGGTKIGLTLQEQGYFYRDDPEMLELRRKAKQWEDYIKPGIEKGLWHHSNDPVEGLVVEERTSVNTLPRGRRTIRPLTVGELYANAPQWFIHGAENLPHNELTETWVLPNGGRVRVK